MYTVAEQCLQPGCEGIEIVVGDIAKTSPSMLGVLRHRRWAAVISDTQTVRHALTSMCCGSVSRAASTGTGHSSALLPYTQYLMM